MRFWIGSTSLSDFSRRLPFLSPHPKRTLIPTKAGFLFIIMTISLGVAAANTGHNFLYLSVSSMLAFIIASGVLSDLNLWRLDIESRWPAEAMAGEKTTVRYRLFNRKKRWPALVIRIEEKKSPIFAPHLPKNSISIPPAGQGSFSTTGIFPRRGRYPLPGYKLTTPIPFGLFIKKVHQSRSDSILVYPSIQSVKILPPPPADPRSEGNQPGGGDPAIEGLRYPREEEPARLIHWKITARLGRLVARDTVHYGQQTAVVSCPVPEHPLSDPKEIEVFEKSVSRAASLVVAHHQAGWWVGLRLGNLFLPPGQGKNHLRRLLETLALVEPGQEK